MNSNPRQTEVAIVGAGIVGLALAYHLSKAGRKVTVFEKNSCAVGASIRNFGMIWPIGQPTGHLLQRALRSREIWMELAKEKVFHLTDSGSLLLAYQEDESEVLEEFVQKNKDQGYQIALLKPKEALQKNTNVQPNYLKTALWSATECIVDPREAISAMPFYLKEKYQVDFHFDTNIGQIEFPFLYTGNVKWQADLVLVCNGADFTGLFPQYFEKQAITKCKLQMMRSFPFFHQEKSFPSLCAGLTLTHYKAFADCPSLKRLKARIEEESPEYVKYGIHVMVSQNASGELIIGDSHEYSCNPEPFDNTLIDDLILRYLLSFASFPHLKIAARWHGIYAKMTDGSTEMVFHPEKGVTVINGLGGAGMTLSFGLAEEIVKNL